jgi:hypothetical protein
MWSLWKQSMEALVPRTLGHRALHDEERRSVGDSLGLCTGRRDQGDETCLGLAAGGAYALLVCSAGQGGVVGVLDTRTEEEKDMGHLARRISSQVKLPPSLPPPSLPPSLSLSLPPSLFPSLPLPLSALTFGSLSAWTRHSGPLLVWFDSTEFRASTARQCLSLGNVLSINEFSIYIGNVFSINVFSLYIHSVPRKHSAPVSVSLGLLLGLL